MSTLATPNPAVPSTLSLPRRGRPAPIPLKQRLVIKRDGRQVPWDQTKMARAVALAFYDARTGGQPNPHRDDVGACFGLDGETFLKVMAIVARGSQMLELYYREGKHPTIEQIQDTLEKAIAAEGEWAVARAYIVWREKKAELRMRRYEDNGLSDYIALSRYSRHRTELGRRETFPEAAERVAEMHRSFFGQKLARRTEREFSSKVEALLSEPADRERLARQTLDTQVGDLLTRAFAAVKEKRVLPSMRSLQFGGDAVLRNNARMYNCSYSAADRVEFFREYYYLLLSGSGCGFSVQKHHVTRLPALPMRGEEIDLPVRHHAVGDTIEGWSDALHALFTSFLEGYKVEFNFSQIRPRGAALKTSGGKAPGHIPLKQALSKLDEILRGARGRQLRPIEVYDICMHIARSVLAGGVRRSATICLFSPDDEEMMTAKTGDWFSKNPQRSASNNSAVILRGSADEAVFRRLFQAQKEFGEPGFYFTSHREYGCNPCCEIGLHPVIEGEPSLDDQMRLRELGVTAEFSPQTRLSGWQMCNLSTINGAAIRSVDDFLDACLHATVIGTLQASYTHIPYLGPVTQFLNERDALLGVSICGFMDNPELLFDPAVLERGARICRAANLLVAAALGINPAARLTCVKPEGTASLLLGAGSGIHPHHARRYFRRVQANRKDPIYRHFRSSNPHMTEASVYRSDTDDVLTFPVEAPPQAILRDEINALEFLQWVRLVQRHWVTVGTAEGGRSPDLHHNVSNTCTVKPDEWDAVADFIWENKEAFTGVSLLSHDGDKRYPQAPREAVTTDDDIAKWNRLKYQKVDYTALSEETDETSHKDIVACAGGACELSV